MRCQWQNLLEILPHWLRTAVSQAGSQELEEIRIRTGHRVQLSGSQGTIWLDRVAEGEDLTYIINLASRYSPWTSTGIGMGYLTASGGHRIGLCGKVVLEHGSIKNYSHISSLCIRVAKDYPGIAAQLEAKESLLIIGSPGSGKTTLLRDLIRQISDRDVGAVCVVDEREELFPLENGKHCFYPGRRTDVISGCAKSQGMEILLRCMNPAVIAVDEITNPSDCDALRKACWCGVRLIATAHAGSLQQLRSRPVYQPLLACGAFEWAVVLQQDKSWQRVRLTS